MKKFAMSMAAFAVITGGLAGCGAGDENNEMGAAPTRYNDTQNVNDMGTRNTTNYDRTYRGEGPVTDMMTVDDRRGGNNSQQRMVGNGSGTTDLREGSQARNISEGNPGGYSNAGMNNGKTGMNNNTGMDDNGNDVNNTGADSGDLDKSRRIANQIENIKGVDDARVIVREQDVIVGIDTYDNTGDTNKDNNLVNKVEKKVKSMLEDQNVEVYVTDDEEQFGNIQQVGDDLQNGMNMDEVGDTIDAMIRDLGSAAREPFRNS